MSDPREEPLGRYLASLPGATPRSGHGADVIERHLRRRRLRRALPLAMAAGVLLALLVARAPLSGDPVPAARSGGATDSAWVEVRALDRRLQAAYIEGVSDARLDHLWQRRESALRTPPGPPDAVTRQVQL